MTIAEQLKAVLHILSVCHPDAPIEMADRVNSAMFRLPSLIDRLAELEAGEANEGECPKTLHQGNVPKLRIN